MHKKVQHSNNHKTRFKKSNTFFIWRNFENFIFQIVPKRFAKIFQLYMIDLKICFKMDPTLIPQTLWENAQFSV